MDTLYKVYLAKLKRKEGNPKCAFKIGITSSSDAMDRLTYDKADEPYPIKKYFPDIKIMASTPRKFSKVEAESIEAYIMKRIQGMDPSFHNWYEKDQVSGITEMRRWNYNEFLLGLQLIKENV
jgi:hypothetical protein